MESQLCVPCFCHLVVACDSLIFWDIDHCTFLCFEDGIHGVTHNLNVKGEANTPKESSFIVGNFESECVFK